MKDIKKYWVIWMPTYIHHDFTKTINSDIECNISDDPKHHQYLKVKLEKNNDIILLFSEINAVGKIIDDRYKIRLEYKSHSCNGLFVYACNPVIDKGDINALKVTNRLLEKTFHAIIYTIKQLYHKHIFHGAPRDSDKDYYFRVYIPDDNEFDFLDIKKENNEAIKFYLDEFEYNFRTSASLFETRIALFEHQGSESNSKFIKWLKDRIDDFHNYAYQKQTCLEECQKVIGETLYTNSIFNSKYLCPEKDDKVRKYLVNLENLKTFFYFVRDYYGYLVDNDSKDKSLKITKLAAWAGILVSIGLAWHSIKISNATDEKINRQLNTIQEVLQKHKEYTDSVSQLEVKQIEIYSE